MSQLAEVFKPNGHVSKMTERAIFGVWILGFFALWSFVKIPFFPQPPEVITAFQKLWMIQGLPYHAAASIRLNVEALLFATAISLALSYHYLVAAVRPLVSAVILGRFLGLTGLFVFFLLAFGSGHKLKLMMLIFGETVFFVTSMTDVVRKIPEDSYNHARTQGMNEWRVVYDVVIRGTLDQAFDIMRQIAAIGWTMLTMVEGISRAEGGLGAMLLNENKHFKLEEVIAIQAVILVIGLVLNDFVIRWLKRHICPHAHLRLERR